MAAVISSTLALWFWAPRANCCEPSAITRDTSWNWAAVSVTWPMILSVASTAVLMAAASRPVSSLAVTGSRWV